MMQTGFSLTDYDYPLPQALIAQYPAKPRDASRMMHLPKTEGDISHYSFLDLPSLLNPGDLLILNDVRVSPCRLLGQKQNDNRSLGARADVLLLEALNERQTEWQAFLKPAKRLPPGTRVIIDDPQARGASLTILETPHSEAESETLMPGKVSLDLGAFQSVPECLSALGHMPLPPYLGRSPEASDQQTYQTTFAQGTAKAMAAPTASLHFTPRVFEALVKKGVQTAMLTLEVGAGTFLPVKAQDIRAHQLHAERYFVPAATLAKINATKAAGKRVIAVGTTVTRTLEAIGALTADTLRASPPYLPERDLTGESSLFIYPGFTFGVIDGLLTNFHLPQSTLLMLVSALAGRKRVLNAYNQAVQDSYRFFSYGDCMLIL
ncbi:MAG: tRNA preQ1(34) S-adenosylmethionine ribosyltransferase-isomerase QueA [Vampirovibrionales bacterium]|nr:tRNA preQ1(34) S-adenosylmethionine ribosyltransferase-isomerase QueA [Vampirovibrionales bacterium]